VPEPRAIAGGGFAQDDVIRALFARHRINDRFGAAEPSPSSLTVRPSNPACQRRREVDPQHFRIFEKEPSSYHARAANGNPSSVNWFFCKLLELRLGFVLVDLTGPLRSAKARRPYRGCVGPPIGIKRFERVVNFSADAEQLNRLTDDLLDRKRRTAAGIAIHLCQHQPVMPIRR